MNGFLPDTNTVSELVSEGMQAVSGLTQGYIRSKI